MQTNNLCYTYHRQIICQVTAIMGLGEKHNFTKARPNVIIINIIIGSVANLNDLFTFHYYGTMLLTRLPNKKSHAKKSS